MAVLAGLGGLSDFLGGLALCAVCHLRDGGWGRGSGGFGSFWVGSALSGSSGRLCWGLCGGLFGPFGFFGTLGVCFGYLGTVGVLGSGF